jgi:hypothetical protein
VARNKKASRERPKSRRAFLVFAGVGNKCCELIGVSFQIDSEQLVQGALPVDSNGLHSLSTSCLVLEFLG